MFDVAKLAPASDSVEIEIFDPTSKEGTGIFIEVYSKDSTRYKELQHGQQNKRFKSLGKRNMGLTVTAEEVEHEALDMLVGCTKGWKGVQWNGEDVKFEASNVRDLYKAVPVIREQVDDAIHDRANFMKR